MHNFPNFIYKLRGTSLQVSSVTQIPWTSHSIQIGNFLVYVSFSISHQVSSSPPSFISSRTSSILFGLLTKKIYPRRNAIMKAVDSPMLKGYCMTMIVVRDCQCVYLIFGEHIRPTANLISSLYLHWTSLWYRYENPTRLAFQPGFAAKGRMNGLHL